MCDVAKQEITSSSAFRPYFASIWVSFGWGLWDIHDTNMTWRDLRRPSSPSCPRSQLDEVIVHERNVPRLFFAWHCLHWVYRNTASKQRPFAAQAGHPLPETVVRCWWTWGNILGDRRLLQLSFNTVSAVQHMVWACGRQRYKTATLAIARKQC